MTDAAVSRKNLQAVAWLGSTSEHEGRAYLQSRIELLSKLMFGSFSTLLAFLMLMYWRYPAIEPEH